MNRRQLDAVRGLVLLGLLVGGALILSRGLWTPPSGEPRSYLLCFWNVENLFDDHLDGWQPPDDRLDELFARQDNLRNLKLKRLCDALLYLNEGKGPDILALCEVEGPRAAQLLRDALNERLTDPALHYHHVLLKDIQATRPIAPAILTRLPVDGNRTRVYPPLRILEGHITVDGHELVIFACHWSSRLSDQTGRTRAKYGDQVYGAFKAMYLANPAVDCVVCGDFNDPPDAPSVTTHLRAIGGLDQVLQSRAPDPFLLGLLAGKDPAAGWGTHYYGREQSWSTFDQIVVSPGLLDSIGWTCEPGSIQVVNTLTHPQDRVKAPWRFDDFRFRGERGFSDHFPVTVRLRCPAGP